jgi:hypothetical protein
VFQLHLCAVIVSGLAYSSYEPLGSFPR